MIEILTPIRQQIKKAREQIRVTALMTGISFADEDIISLRDTIGYVVFLQQFNPRGYINKEGELVTEYTHPLWTEQPARIMAYPVEDISKPIFGYNVLKPRIVCPFPQLVRIVTEDGRLIYERSEIVNLLQNLDIS